MVPVKQQTYNQEFSCMGPLIVPVALDFRTSLTAQVDLSSMVQQNQIDFISGIYVNINGLNTTLKVLPNLTQQVVDIRSNTQGYYPLMLGSSPVINFVAGGLIPTIITVIFYNIPFVPYVDGSISFVSNGLTDAQLRASPVPVTDTSLAAPTLVDMSLAMTGASQTLAIAGAADNYLIIQNPAGNANVTVNLAGGNALTSGIVIAGGGSLELNKGTTTAVTIAGTNTQLLKAFGG